MVAKNKKQARQPLKKVKCGRRGNKAVLCVVPRKENNFKPSLINRYGIILVIVVAICIQLVYNFTQTGSVLGQVVDITSDGLLEATNEERAKANTAALRLNDELSQAAELKAEDMMKNQYWEHTSPSGVTPWHWINQAGYRYEQAGENLARNFTTADGAVAGWMASDSHKRNMLKASYTEVGFASIDGELDGEPTTIVVALYAKPVLRAVAASQNQGKGSPFVAIAKMETAEVDSKPLSVATRMGIAVQSLTPAAMTSIALLFVSATVATTSHAFRRSLPKKQRRKWYQEHGAAKASLLLMVIGFIILLYGGGSL